MTLPQQPSRGSKAISLSHGTGWRMEPSQASGLSLILSAHMLTCLHGRKAAPVGGSAAESL